MWPWGSVVILVQTDLLMAPPFIFTCLYPLPSIIPRCFFIQSYNKTLCSHFYSLKEYSFSSLSVCLCLTSFFFGGGALSSTLDLTSMRESFKPFSVWYICLAVCAATRTGVGVSCLQLQTNLAVCLCDRALPTAPKGVVCTCVWLLTCEAIYFSRGLSIRPMFSMAVLGLCCSAGDSSVSSNLPLKLWTTHTT